MILWIEDYSRQGWPTNLMLTRCVSGFTRDGRAKRFKIGLTNNPPARAGQYSASGCPYSRMVVIYKTRSRRNAGEVERLLIELYREHADNLRKGGAGRYPKTAWKYVYLVLGYKRPYRN